MPKRLFLCLMLCLFLSTRAFGQCHIEGTVREGPGTPVAGAVVLLMPQNLVATTDASGSFRLGLVAFGASVRLSVFLPALSVEPALQVQSKGRPLPERVVQVGGDVERVDVLIQRPVAGAVPAVAKTPRHGRARTKTAVAAGPRLPVLPGIPTAPPEIQRAAAMASPEPTNTRPAAAGAVLNPETSSRMQALYANATDRSGGARGSVRSADGLSVPGANVTLQGTSAFTTSDTEGKYLLVDLPPGEKVVLVASAPGFQDAVAEVTVSRGTPVTADFVLPLAGYTDAVTVVSEVPMLKASDGTSRVTLRPEQVAALPSLGEKDIFRALQLLPGVTGSQEASSGLYVRGGTPDQNLVSYDGYTLYHVDHLFGYFSAFNMDAVDQVEFSKTALNAGDGGRLSSVLRLTGKAKTADYPTGFANISMLSTGGLFSTPLGKHASFLFAGRRSFQSPLYNDVLGLFSGSTGTGGPPGRAARFSGGVFQSTPESWFYDMNGRLDVTPTTRDRISLSLYKGRDDLDNSRDLSLQGPMLTRLSEEGVTLPSDAVMQISDVQGWHNRGLGATWNRQWSSRASTLFSVGYSEYANSRVRANVLTSPTTGEDYSVSVGRGGSGGAAEDNSLRDVTVRLRQTMGIGDAHVLSVGAESTDLNIDYAIQTEALAPRPDGAVGSQLVGLLDRSGQGQVLAFYAQDTWTPSARLIVSPGLRVARYDVTGQSYFEPRISATYQASRRVQLKGGYGLYHQMAQRIMREDLAQGDREFWTLSDGTTVPVPRSMQYVFGGTFENEDLPRRRGDLLQDLRRLDHVRAAPGAGRGPRGRHVVHEVRHRPGGGPRSVTAEEVRRQYRVGELHAQPDRATVSRTRTGCVSGQPRPDARVQGRRHGSRCQAVDRRWDLLVRLGPTVHAGHRVRGDHLGLRAHRGTTHLR